MIYVPEELISAWSGRWAGERCQVVEAALSGDASCTLHLRRMLCLLSDLSQSSSRLSRIALFVFP